MPSANCFDAPTLKNYLLGKLTDDQSDVVAMHLEACLNCEATVAELDRASDTLTSGLRLPAMATEPATDDALQKALDKVQSLELAAEHRPTSEVSADHSPVLRDYRLLEPLGFGGMGTVYKAVHTRLDRLVAVKLLPARRLGDEQAVARFQREMRVIGQLSHPAIVQATDAGEVDGTHFLVMEYVEGCDLNSLAKACGPLSLADACEIARQAALGLEYAHQQGIIHRDIKPSNLMLSRNSEFGGRKSESNLAASASEFRIPNSPLLKILDLGLALLSGEQAPVDELTTVGQLMGTLDYMAPEQLEDSHLVGPRADIYALAATLYRLLTGVAPFAKDDRKTPLQKLRALATQAAPPICERRADVPEELAAIIDRALSRDPAARFLSMSEFAAALTPWCAGHNLGELVRHISNLPVPSDEWTSARRGSPDPAAWLDRRSPSNSRRAIKAGPHSGDLRSAPAAGSGDPRRALRGHVENVPHDAHPRRTLFVTLTLLFLATLGIVITIETNKGTLIVESLRDGVEVRVKKSGKSVEKLELTTGPKSARLTAGEYEIEILGNADGLQIQNGKFVLKRGDTVVAKITEKPKAIVAVTPAGVGMTPPITKSKDSEPPAVSQPRKPVEIVDRTAKGMETFEASNPDLAAEKQIRDLLQKSISVEFEDIPLNDVLKFLEEQTQVVFFLENGALTEQGLATDTPITLSLTDKPATTVLKFLLRPMQLAWHIDGGQVVVTTLQKEQEVFVTRTYPVGKLLPGVSLAVTRLKSEPLLQLLRGQQGGGGGFGGGGSGGGFFHVSSTSHLVGTLPALFGQFGGGGGGGGQPPAIPTEASHFADLLGESLGYQWADRDGEGGTCELLHNVLVVRHTRRAQADIESLLRTVEAAFLKPLTEPVEIRPAGYSLEADENVRRQLARKMDVAFDNTSLADVTHFLSEKLEVQVLIDREALTEENIPTDVPVTLQFQGIAGDVLMSRWLKPLQLAHDIENGLLVITTRAKLQDRHVTKVYDVRELFDRGLHPSRLIAGLQKTTPGPWSATEGEGGTLTLFADTLLAVRQTSRSHDEVAKFLVSLRSQLVDQPVVPRAVLPQSTPEVDLGELIAPQPLQPQPGLPTTSTKPPAKPTADSQPRFDGKTFDEWLAVLDTERSPARLADAIEALRLLGRDTHADQVAERVLKLLRVVDFDIAVGADNRPSIFPTLRKFLDNLPAPVVQRAGTNELKNGNTRSRQFVLIHSILLRIESPLADKSLGAAIMEATHDSDAQIRKAAIKTLGSFTLQADNSRLADSQIACFREALKDNVNEIAMLAAEALRDIGSESNAVAEAFARVVAKPDSPDQRMNALNQIAVMGPRAASVAPRIAAVLLEPLGDETIRLDPKFDNWLGSFRSERHNTFHFVAAIALARMGKAAAAELPTIEKALVSPGAMKGYEDRKSAELKGIAQWPDVLQAVKSRLSEPAALDLRGGDQNTVFSAIRIYERSYHLLMMEAALLQQIRGQKTSEVKELLAQAEIIRQDVALVEQLNNLRRYAARPQRGDTAQKEVLSFWIGLLETRSEPAYDQRPTETSTGTRILAESPREAAIRELGKLGPAAHDALPVLKKELESKDKPVAAAAEKAIKQIEAAKDDQKTD